jgi:hypothetical protein
MAGEEEAGALAPRVEQGPQTIVHRRPGYPLSGCVPAEPDSVSPGDATVTILIRRNKSNDPERLLGARSDT